MSFFGTLVSAGQTHAHNIRLRLIVWCKVQSGFLSSSLHEVSTSFLDLMTFSVKEKWSGKDRRRTFEYSAAAFVSASTRKHLCTSTVSIFLTLKHTLIE